MQPDQLKTVFWLWLFKTLQPCLGGRRSSCDPVEPSTYSRLGRLPLSGDSFAMWRSGGVRTLFNAPSRRHNAGTVFPDNYHGLTLCDESVAQQTTMKSKWKRRDSKTSSTTTKTDTAPENKAHSAQLTQPLIDQEAWDATTGLEFQDSSMVEALTQSGLDLCTANGDENPYVEWFPHPNTDKLLEDHGDAMLAMEEGNVMVYIGKAKRQKNIVGSNLPLIKTQSILPMSADEMADLLMDSSKVKIYNKMSLGRKDVRTFGKHTKIVRNLTQPPVAKSKMVSVTMMHSRALTDKDRLPNGPTTGYIVVSRAVPGVVDDDLKDLPRNDILLGVNLLQDLGPNECLMTAVTHVYSPALPTMFAQSMGVNSAVNFVRDIRQVCQPAATGAAAAGQ